MIGLWSLALERNREANKEKGSNRDQLGKRREVIRDQ